MKKLILPISLVFLVGLIILASANSMIKKGGPYETEVYLSEGWNLISGTIPKDGILADSDIKIGDISAMWYYSPLQKKYLRVYPNTDWDSINQDDEDFVLTSAMWIYSKRMGVIKYSTLEDYPSLENRQLYTGWNLVSMTPDMIEGSENPELTFEDIKGNCNVEKAYYFFDGNWKLFDMPEMDSTLLGKGMAIKVSDDCKLGSSSSGINPPGLPESYMVNVCTINAPFGCDEYKIEVDKISLNIRNGGGEDYTISSINVTDCTEYTTSTLVTDGTTTGAIAITCTGLASGAKVKKDIAITYMKTVGGTLSQIATGTISGRVP